MKPEYERASLTITEFDTKNVITTSGEDPFDPSAKMMEKENVYKSFRSFGAPGQWF